MGSSWDYSAYSKTILLLGCGLLVRECCAEGCTYQSFFFLILRGHFFIGIYFIMISSVFFLSRQHLARGVLISMTYTSGLEKIQVRCAFTEFFLILSVVLNYRLRVRVRLEEKQYYLT